MKSELWIAFSSALLIFWLFRVLRFIKGFLFAVISFYLLSLLLLAKTGFITVHIEKFQEVYQVLESWFTDFVRWIASSLDSAV